MNLVLTKPYELLTWSYFAMNVSERKKTKTNKRDVDYF